ncbi:coiled-coil domain-containing protein 30 isoform X2 [Tiliqua scincoides]|uniref:coiled-coil domain-containing protein 30 isoform X2 n=1 Tax=Tiliqua scincoides TaxID=71010 RepID=UPI003461CADD
MIDFLFQLPSAWQVENYVGHVRTLTEARDALALEFEKENQQLRMEFMQLQLQHESQQKEVEEMLEQEGLVDVAHSSPSEQVAYLLVERSTLLERLEGLEQKLDSPGCLEKLCASQLQSHADELARECTLCKQAEQDLDEAAQRLHVAHREIQRLIVELDTQKKEQSKLAPPVAETLREEMNKVKDNETSELQEARERNIRLDKEVLALHHRVHCLDYERKMLLVQVNKLRDKIPKDQTPEGEPQCLLAETDVAEEQAFGSLQEKNEAEGAEATGVLNEAVSDRERDAAIHKRCHQVIESVKCQNAQLLHKLHKLQQEHEDLVERNEELESLLGETQNQAREEHEQFECAIDGLQRKVCCLEAELQKAQKMKTDMRDESQDCQEVLKTHQEKVEFLERKLSEETEWRKQLMQDLEAMQKTLKGEKKELHNSRLELLRLNGELQMLQKAAEDRDFLNETLEKLQQENLLLEAKVSELSQEYEQLSQLVAGQTQPDQRLETSGRTCPELVAKEKIWEDQLRGLGEEKEQLCVKLLESQKKMEEWVMQVKRSHEERQLLHKENDQLRKDLRALRNQLSNATILGTKQEAGCVGKPLLKPQAPAGDMGSEVNQEKRPPKEDSPCTKETYPFGDRLLQEQRQQDLQQLRQDFRRVQTLCNSAEKELRYEREKNLELTKHTALLQQENTTVKAEWRQAQVKLSESNKECASLTSQCEQSHQKVRELELELLKHSQALKQRSGLQEKLSLEKTRAAEAESRVLELQCKLKECCHRLRLSEIQILEQKQLEEYIKQARENEEKAEQQFQEEQRKSKLLDQQVEELQQQLRHAFEKEAQMTELQVQCQQQRTQLQVLEEEKKTLSNEHLHCQKYSQKLSEQRLALQQEKDALCEEFRRILEQMDVSIRKHHERQLHHKAKLRRAKETFICEVKKRDMRIKELESEVTLVKSQMQQDRMRISQVTAENNSLLQEKRRILEQLQELKEAEKSSKQVLFSAQNRGRLLDKENKQLQERILQLTSQVCALERALRSIHSHSLEELRSVGFSDCQLRSKPHPLPNISFSVTGLPDSLGLLKAIQDAQPEEAAERSLLSPSPCPPSEIGYLNVASPGDAAVALKEEQSQPFN